MDSQLPSSHPNQVTTITPSHHPPGETAKMSFSATMPFPLSLPLSAPVDKDTHSKSDTSPGSTFSFHPTLQSQKSVQDKSIDIDDALQRSKSGKMPGSTLYFHQTAHGQNQDFVQHTNKNTADGGLNSPSQINLIKTPHQKNLNSMQMINDKKFISQHRAEIKRLNSLIQDLELGEGSAGGDILESERNLEIRLVYESRLDGLNRHLIVYEGLKTRILSNLQECQPNQISAQLQRDLYRFQGQLPIFSKRVEIENHVESDNSRFLIIQGQTGSGKSTQLPQYFADHPKFKGQKILCTQPRKIAAISLAKRVAFEYSCGKRTETVGGDIGYRVKGQKMTSARTRIEFLTEGKMLENIIGGKTDPFKNVGVIILDEAHERSLTCDLLLGCFRLPDPRWNHIKIVITSATIDLDQFSKFFDQAPTVLVEGRTFPVSVNYIPSPSFGIGDSAQGIVKAAVSCALDIHLAQALVPGDILCFLPGQGDVLSAISMFESQYRHRLEKHRKGKVNARREQQSQEGLPMYRPVNSEHQVGYAPTTEGGGIENQGQVRDGNGHNSKVLEPHILPLYGRLEAEEQEKIFEPMSNDYRKIIFATDIAETSVTIDGIVHVVDPGVKKGISYDAKRKISSLQIQQISKSNAIQRMGRAGRTQPGECYRLYRPEDFETMEIGTNPEVLQRPLALAVLTLRKLRMNPTTFPWISQPPLEALKSAEEELILLGALTSADDEGEGGGQELTLTELGHVISSVQQEPSLVKMIHYGAQLGFGSAATTLASILPVSNIFFWNGKDEETKGKGNKKKKDFSVPEGDIVSLYRAFEEWTRVSDSGRSTKGVGAWCQENYVNGKAMKIIMSSIAELKSYFRTADAWKSADQDAKPTNEELSRIAFSGLFLNTAHIVKAKTSRGNLQYFSLHTGVLGNCSRGSALTHHPNPPDWIVYDRVLQIPITLFLSCNQIRPEWIEAENPDFYKSCLEKRSQLPTTLTKCVSSEIIVSLLGKFYSNVQILQNELDSFIESDLDSGCLTIYCARNKVSQVDSLLDQKIRAAIVHLEEKVIELDYLGGCRLLIGQGYQVKDVLFYDDFVTVFVRNLVTGFQEEDLRDFVLDLVRNSKDRRIRQIQIFRGTGSGNGLITFHSKETAQEFHQKVSNQELYVQGQRVQTNPSLGKRKGMSVEIMGKLKFSWSTAPSKQQAKIWFKSGAEANRFIENAGRYLEGATIHGVGVKNDPHNRKTMHTPTMRIQAPKGYPMPARFRFDLDRIQLMSEMERRLLEYPVTVKSIPISLDEYGIKDALRHFKVERVRLDRHPVSEETKANNDVSQSLLPVQKWLNEAPNSTFEDKDSGRKGVWIDFKRLGLLREAYREIVSSAPWRDMEKCYGQPKRLEIEYFYTATILRELYQIFETEIQSIIDYATSLKIRVVNSAQNQSRGQNRSKFVYVKFQGQSQAHFPEIQERMEAVTACTKYESDHIHLLFTRTGKVALTRFRYWEYMFTSVHSQGVWIYGDAELRARIVEKLNGIVKHFKELDFLDYQIPLNKKVVRSNRDKVNIEKELGRVKPLEFAAIVGSTVMVSGRSADVAKLEKILREKQYIFNQHRQKFLQESKLGECGLCFTEPEDGKYVVTTGCKGNGGDNCCCGRVFCLDCIQPMFDQIPPVFPLKCPTCETELVINDILKWALPGSLRKVMEVSVGDYRQKNSEKIRSCPKPGCEQLLPTGSTTKGAYGGDFIFCDECMTSYCIDCTKKMGKTVLMHEDESCAEIQSGSSNRVRIHVKTIQESILNLQCPRCKAAFIDFNGCAALTCGVSTCGCGFCALCLQDCGGSQETHAHVVNCKWNEGKSFVVNPTALDGVHKTIRIEKIRKYLNEVSYEEQENILKIMCKDLLDLGITLAAVKVHLVPTSSESQSTPASSQTPPHELQDQPGLVPNRQIQLQAQPRVVPQGPILQRQAQTGLVPNRQIQVQAQPRGVPQARILQRQAQPRFAPQPAIQPQPPRNARRRKDRCVLL